MASVLGGLSLGDKVIVEGLQRVRPGQPVSPGPASAQMQKIMNGANDDRKPTGGDAAGSAKPAGNSK
jgi:membrane fusion protein, multidrug efflux system